MPESLEKAVEEFLILVTVGATMSELTEPMRAMKEALEEREHTMDLDRIYLGNIMQAADESNWIPPEYFMNDWMSDVCDFLRNGINDPTTEELAEIIVADLERVTPLSGSEMRYDAETGCVDFNGTFRPIEIATRIREAYFGS